MVHLLCVEHRTRHCVPLLLDMKIHFALLKLCYGAAYVPWNVPQLLLGFALVYGVLHNYEYCVELIYRPFLPLIKFLEQGNSLQVGSILPRRARVIHKEKTLLGLMLATSSNRGTLDERVAALLSSQRDLTPIQRKGLRMLSALKALLYTYCPAALSIGTLVSECNWKGRGASSGIIADVAKRWGGVAPLVKFVGPAAVDAMVAMEERGLHPALGTFKEVEGIMYDQLREIVGYMDGTKSTLLCLKKNCKRCGKRPDVVLAHTSSQGGCQWSTTPEVCFCQTGVCIRIN